LENQGERDFILHLKKFCLETPEFFEDKELYLLRNMSRGRGIGFFEAGNFHPDFIVWMLVGGRQFISFVDPKGLRNIKGKTDPKIEFHTTIKQLEDDLRDQDSNITLNSFIVSSTPFLEISSWWNMTKQELEDCHVFFQQEDMGTYIYEILTKSLGTYQVS